MNVDVATLTFGVDPMGLGFNDPKPETLRQWLSIGTAALDSSTSWSATQELAQGLELLGLGVSCLGERGVAP